MLEVALRYANLGWRVFPLHSIGNGICTCGKGDCNSPGKHPATRDGFKSATIDPKAIKGWWSKSPNLNIGIETGQRSGLFVLDIDVSDTKDGLNSLLALEDLYGKLPETLSVATGGGGLHLYFQIPANGAKSSAGRLGKFVDVRADGGYVVAPPSKHISGNDYRWSVPK